MARRKRETDEERARRDREERIALLKMKQGLIEESELIPESGYEKPPEPRGLSKLGNFFYHNKAFILIGAFFAALIIFFVVQIATREKEDLYVLAIGFDENSELGWRTQTLKSALEKYCPDFDENGEVHVTVNFIDRTSGGYTSQYDQAQIQKLTAEFLNASAQMLITDEGIVDWLVGDEDAQNAFDPQKVFLSQTDKCSDDMLFDGYGVRINRTALAKELQWETCPDNVIIVVRDELKNGFSTDSVTEKSRERASIVLQNILDNNIVNPETPGE